MAVRLTLAEVMALEAKRGRVPRVGAAEEAGGGAELIARELLASPRLGLRALVDVDRLAFAAAVDPAALAEGDRDDLRRMLPLDDVLRAAGVEAEIARQREALRAAVARVAAAWAPALAQAAWSVEEEDEEEKEGDDASVAA